MKRSTLALAAGMMVLFVGSPLAPAASALRKLESDHFVLVCRARDLDAGKVTAEMMQKWSNWMESAYSRFVGDKGLGFRPPAAQTVHLNGKDVIKVFIVDFGTVRSGNEASTLRGYATYQGVLYLNLAAFGDSGKDPANKCTIAHELFHLIQHAYNPDEAAWLAEATARWAPAAIYNDVDQREYCVPTEVHFVRYAYLPLAFDFSAGLEAKRSALRNKYGHPYGASALFRFLSRQAGGNEVVRRVWEESGKAAPGQHSLEAVAHALGAGSMVDAKFRAVYDRFAVGCVLNDLAPADCQLADVDKLRTGGTKVRLLPTDLSTGWLEYCKQKLKAPETPAFTPQFANPPDLSAVMTTGRTGGATSVDAPKGWLGGSGGIRCFALAKAPELPKNATLEVVLHSDQDDISLQGAARYGPSDPVQLFKATYDAAAHSYTLRIPHLDQTGSHVLVIATRYSGPLNARNYPITFALKTESPVMYRVYKGRIADAGGNRATDPHRFGGSIIVLVFAATPDRADFAEARIIISYVRSSSPPYMVGERYTPIPAPRDANWYCISNRNSVKTEYAAEPKPTDTSISGTLQVRNLPPYGPVFKFQAALVKELTREEYGDPVELGPGFKAIVDKACEEIGERK